MDYRDWRRRSIQSVWHPYTEITSFEKEDFPIIDHAEGSTLYDIEGRALLDGISSWWCTNLGHGHPRLVKAIQEQAAHLQHTLLGGMSHPPPSCWRSSSPALRRRGWDMPCSAAMAPWRSRRPLRLRCNTGTTAASPAAPGSLRWRMATTATRWVRSGWDILTPFTAPSAQPCSLRSGPCRRIAPAARSGCGPRHAV